MSFSSRAIRFGAAVLVSASSAVAEPSLDGGASSLGMADGPRWTVGAAVVFTRYTPSFSGLPRGTSASVSAPGMELAVGRRLSSRLWLHVSAVRAWEDESEWESDPIGGRALVPTPGLWSLLATLRTPLYQGRVVPFVAVGGGLTRFDEVDESVRFEWPSIEENNRVEFAARTDGTLVFDLGASVPWTRRWETELSYRLLSVFSDDRVNTIDHLTLSGIVRF